MKVLSRVETRNGRKVLIVNEEPFIMLAGEVHNSNSSSVEYMEGVYDQADALGMNSLLLPVTWELVEPEEGVFDFSLMDALIMQARARGKKLGFLWFGAWKNAQCYYAPAWVKTDLVRFRRAQMEKGKNLVRLKDFYGMSYTSLSYLCDETREADARAFGRLMRHLCEVDGEIGTVVAVQVENETGVMGNAREVSDEADALYAKAVPQAFVEHMKANVHTLVPDVKEAVQKGADSGSWEEVFGACAEEIFSAYHIASYVNAVAAAGKAEYPLPMTVNCWLDKGEKPGMYPSGGPVARMMEVWEYCAPHIDVFAPDIYVPDFPGVCDAYTKRGNPLFIPECATHSYAGVREAYVVGHYHAMCYSPFGFEDIGKPFNAQQGALFGMDVSDPALKTPQNVEEYYWFTHNLQEMMPLLAAKYGTADLQAVCSERKEENEMVFGSFGFRVILEHARIKDSRGVCLVLKETEDTFYVMVHAAGLAFFTTDEKKPNAGILVLEEGRFQDGVWMAGRRFNGDEASSMIYEERTMLKVKLYAYE